VLRASVAYAELRERSRQALGRERLLRDFDIAALISVYATTFNPVTGSTYAAEIPEAEFRQAMIGDLESVFDRCVAQCLAYGYLLDSEVDPVWTAVTGYYAAFFGVRLLHAAIGTGTRSLPAAGQITPALYRYWASSSVYPDRIVLNLR